MERVPPFNAQQLTAIAKALGNTSDGLTGSQIEYLLAQCKIPDTHPTLTKWQRLFNAFAAFQNKRDFGNHVVVFIKHAMAPVQFTADPARFVRWKDRINPILAFSGMSVGDDGKVRWVKAASNLVQVSTNLARWDFLTQVILTNSTATVRDTNATPAWKFYRIMMP